MKILTNIGYKYIKDFFKQEGFYLVNEHARVRSICQIEVIYFKNGPSIT